MCGCKTDILDGEVSRTLHLERAKCRDRSSGSEKDTNLGGGLSILRNGLGGGGHVRTSNLW